MAIVLSDAVAPALRYEMMLRDKAMAGDIQWVCTPATTTRPATSTPWTRSVVVRLCTAAGETHTWFTKSIVNGVSASRTGTATISLPGGTTLNIVNGQAVVTLEGSGTWVATNTNTLTVAAHTIMGTNVAQATSVETIT